MIPSTVLISHKLTFVFDQTGINSNVGNVFEGLKNISILVVMIHILIIIQKPDHPKRLSVNQTSIK